MTTGKYILDESGQPIEETNLIKWAKWMENTKFNHHVADDSIGGVRVSTVFLGLDHAFSGGPPILWETQVFGGPLDGEMIRYSSRETALAGHVGLLAQVRSGNGKQETKP